MTDKEILKQIKGAEKIKPYAVDTAAIRRGKANLALMMTLTTADHYDWFIGKFIGSSKIIRTFSLLC